MINLDSVKFPLDSAKFPLALPHIYTTSAWQVGKQLFWRHRGSVVSQLRREPWLEDAQLGAQGLSVRWEFAPAMHGDAVWWDEHGLDDRRCGHLFCLPRVVCGVFEVFVRILKEGGM